MGPGHIPGALDVPFYAVLDMATQRYLPVEQLREVFAPVLAENPDRVVTYCGGAVAASSVAFALGLLGFDGIGVYDGSTFEWASDPSLPLEVGA